MLYNIFVTYTKLPRFSATFTQHEKKFWKECTTLPGCWKFFLMLQNLFFACTEFHWCYKTFRWFVEIFLSALQHFTDLYELAQIGLSNFFLICTKFVRYCIIFPWPVQSYSSSVKFSLEILQVLYNLHVAYTGSLQHFHDLHKTLSWILPQHTLQNFRFLKSIVRNTIYSYFLASLASNWLQTDFKLFLGLSINK